MRWRRRGAPCPCSRNPCPLSASSSSGGQRPCTDASSSRFTGSPAPGAIGFAPCDAAETLAALDAPTPRRALFPYSMAVRRKGLRC